MPEEFPQPLSPPEPDGGPIRAGLLGRGIGASLSPRIHRLAAERTGVELRYELFDLDEAAGLGPLLDRLHEEGYWGLNVTMPYKRRLQDHLLGMSPEAICAGSVNLLLRGEEGWIGENTDVEGFFRPLHRRRLAFDCALLLGAGGAARSVMQVLVSMPFVECIQVWARREGEAQALAEEYETPGRSVMALRREEGPARAPGLVVNATPQGMEGHAPEALACPADWIPKGGVCFDLVYRPRWTPLLKAARSRGGEVIHGLEMLVYQAAGAFEKWTGASFPAEGILARLEEEERGR